MTDASTPGPRPVRAPRGSTLTCRGWGQEAAMRMLMNNLDPEVAEHPDQLIVYGGSGRAARSWGAYDAIVRTQQGLAGVETLLVPQWATWDEVRRLEAAGLTMFGQMTAGSWI